MLEENIPSLTLAIGSWGDDDEGATINNCFMYYYSQNLINHNVDDEPDPSAANALQEGRRLL